MSLPEYETWKNEPTPENMASTVKALEPTINAEVQRYSGPKPLLRSKAMVLAAKAVKSYDPAQGAKLRSWVVTQLQPLSRYGQSLRPIQASEVAIRQAAEVNRIREEMADRLDHEPSLEELADETGLSVRRIENIQKQVKPAVPEAVFIEGDAEGASLPGTVTSDILGTAEEMVYDSLTHRDKLIYDWKTGKHGKPTLSNQVIAKRLGVTPALISQRSQQIALQIQDLARRKSL